MHSFGGDKTDVGYAYNRRVINNCCEGRGQNKGDSDHLTEGYSLDVSRGVLNRLILPQENLESTLRHNYEIREEERVRMDVMRE